MTEYVSVIHGWGRQAGLRAMIREPGNRFSAAEALGSLDKPVIPRGMGRAYGDSALAGQVISTARLNLLTAFDPEHGLLRCGAGAVLGDLLQWLVPLGWMIPVLPGTRFVSVGGAIASDVHGKNHHHEGCFSTCVESMEILLGNGEIAGTSRTEHADLFRATCGGMGLTGLVLSAQLRLQRIRGTDMHRQVKLCRNLPETLDRFSEIRDAPFSVAWMDALAAPPRFGRCVLEHAEFSGGSEEKEPPVSRLPLPGMFSPMRRVPVRCFNQLHWWAEQVRGSGAVHYERVFFPLDRWKNWNRLYGRSGLAQYQCVIPNEAAESGVMGIMDHIQRSGIACLLAVLKVLGPENSHPLSFPLAGVSLALDFRVQDGLQQLFTELDARVLAHGGRVYLTKDMHLSANTFRAMYPRWESLQEVRHRYHAMGRFASLQSRRLGLD